MYIQYIHTYVYITIIYEREIDDELRTITLKSGKIRTHMTVVKKIKSNTVKKPLEKTVQNIVKKR